MKYDKEKIILRPARSRDCCLLFKWANDPLVRQNSINSDPLDWEIHRKWFNEKMRHPEKSMIFIAEISNNNAVGQIRFDKKDKGIFIDFSVKAINRGQGVGTVLLEKGIKTILKKWPDVWQVSAIVKPNNWPSIKAFERQGFILIKKSSILEFNKYIVNSKKEEFIIQQEIKIGGKKIGAKSPPFIIAEMSGNHNQSLDRALAIVEAAAKCGCDALKIQTYTADTMTINSKRKEFLIENRKSLWKGYYLYDLYQKTFTPWEWHKVIFDKCKKLGIIGFSTAFDEKAVDFLESLNVPVYKIASFENIHMPLIKKIASTQKPLIISTGMATITELGETMRIVHKYGSNEIILLKCTSAYPASPKEANLKTIPHLASVFKCHVGLSDHTRGIGVSLASIALGARVIERHLTIDRADGGLDSAFSLEPHEMKTLVEEGKKAFYALGDIHYGCTKFEQENIRFRRSIFAIKDIGVGKKFTKKNIKIIRPGYGLAPCYFDSILERKSSKSITKGTPLTWRHIAQ